MIFEVLWPRAGGVPECSYSVPGTWIGDAPHRGDEVRHEATPLPRPSGHRMAESVADLIYGQIQKNFPETPQEELDAGQRRMERSWAHIKQFLLAVLAQDPQVRPGAFHEGFSAEDFVDLLFSLLLAALLRKDAPCAPILALIRRTIY